MRIEGAIKMGYFPTPDSIIALIKTYLQYPADTFPVLDPCAGKGEAAAEIGGPTGVVYGVEPDYARSREAKMRLRKVACSSIEGMKISNEAFALLFLNPPYDATYSLEESASIRMEYAFLRDTEKYLAPGGVLVYIVPEKRFEEERLVRYLTSRFSQITIGRFPGSSFEDFGQVVLIAKKKTSRSLDDDSTQWIVDTAKEGFAELEAAPEPVYKIPSGLLTRVPLFRSPVIDKEDLLADLKASPLWGRMESLTTPRDLSLSGRPAMPFHSGHIALLLASGALNGVMGVKNHFRGKKNEHGHYTCPDCGQEIAWIKGSSVHFLTDEELAAGKGTTCPECHATLVQDTRHLIKGVVQKRQREVERLTEHEDDDAPTRTRGMMEDDDDEGIVSVIDYYEISIQAVTPNGTHVKLT